MITQDELAGIDIFSSLTRGQQARIAGRSADIHVNSGEWVSYDGDPAYFWGVLDGEVEVLRRVAGEEHRVTTFESGESFGEIMLTLGTTSFGCVRALRKSRLARIDGGDFHTMLAESPEVAATIAATLSRRVTLIREAYTVAPTSRVTIVGTRDDLLCHDIRDFLARNHVPYEWFDPSDASDRECVAASVPGGVRHPAVAFADGTVLEDPTLREIARRLALRIEPEGGTYDVAIVGAGPAGLGAAVYAGSEGLRTIMIEREAPGGQAGTSSRIENYLGFPGGISGGDLASRALHQAERLGAEILVTRTVDRLLLDGEPRTLVLRRRHYRDRTGRRPGLGRDVADARSGRRGPARRPRRLLRRGADRGARHARPVDLPDRRRELGGAGGDVLLELRRERDAARAR